VDGNADAAVEARIRNGWNKFRQLVPLLLGTLATPAAVQNLVQIRPWGF